MNRIYSSFDHLVAQAYSPMIQNSVSPGLIVFFLGIAGAMIVAILLLIRAGLGTRADAERAKLFEMGYYLPQRASRWPQALFCTGMGLGVPIAALYFADVSGQRPETSVVTCIVSCVAIVGATLVAAIVFHRPEPSGQLEKLFESSSKPSSDPDALDFAGRLGRG